MKFIYLLLLLPFTIHANEIQCDFFTVNTYQFCTPLGGIKLDVPLVKQKRPLSCEAAALASALNYLGIDITEEKIIDQMPFDKTIKSNGVWGDPDSGFVGDIDGRSIESGYGIYWRPLAKLSSAWILSTWLMHGSLSDITDQIKQGKPVLVWISALKNAEIIFWKTNQGKMVRALRDQHVVVVTGYEGSAELPLGFYLMDPDEGMRFMNYTDFISRWDRFERPVVIFLN